MPAEVFLTTEKYYLQPAPTPEIFISHDSILTRSVHKDNTIWYNSNRYTVPIGTYNQSKEVEIKVNDEKGILLIYNIDNSVLIAKHYISLEKGKLIQNTNHLRDYSQKIHKLIDDMTTKLGEFNRPFLLEIKRLKPRYVRDQLQVIKDLIKQYGLSQVQDAISYCIKNNIYNISDLKDVIQFMVTEKVDKKPKLDSRIIQPKTIDEKIMTVDTAKRDINFYCELVGDNHEI